MSFEVFGRSLAPTPVRPRTPAHSCTTDVRDDDLSEHARTYKRVESNNKGMRITEYGPVWESGIRRHSFIGPVSVSLTKWTESHSLPTNSVSAGHA